MTKANETGFARWLYWRPWVACAACGFGKNCADPQHEKDGITRSPQRDFIRNWISGKECWMTGANSAGKTELLAWIIACVLRGYIPPPYDKKLREPSVVWLVAPEKVVAQGSMEDKLFHGKTTLGQPPFFDLGTYTLASKHVGNREPHRFDNGSEFLIRGTSSLARTKRRLGQREEALSLTAARITLGVMDEPCPEAAYDELQARVSQGLPLIGAATFNPRGMGAGWFNRRIWKPWKTGSRPRLFVCEASTRDNPYVPDENWQRMSEAWAHDPILYASKLKGQFSSLEGASLFSEEAGIKMEGTIGEPLLVAEHE